MSIAGTAQRAAANTIRRYGVALTLVRTVPGAYDPATGTTGNTVTNVPIRAVVSRASGGTVQAFDVRFENGTLIETNLRSLLIAAKGLPFMPHPGDVVTGLEGSTWTILGCTPESFMGVDITYSATVKR